MRSGCSIVDLSSKVTLASQWDWYPEDGNRVGISDSPPEPGWRNCLIRTRMLIGSLVRALPPAST